MILRLKPVWPLIPQPYKYVVKEKTGVFLASIECPFYHYPSGLWYQRNHAPEFLLLTPDQCTDPHDVDPNLSIETRPEYLSEIEQREYDLGLAPDPAYTSPFVTPESVVNDVKAGQS